MCAGPALPWLLLLALTMPHRVGPETFMQPTPANHYSLTLVVLRLCSQGRPAVVLSTHAGPVLPLLLLLALIMLLRLVLGSFSLPLPLTASCGVKLD
jgi:hypothetical protein